MADRENRRLGAYVETSAGGERVRAYVPAPLPPDPSLDLARFMRLYERAMAAVGRLDGMTTILPSTPLFRSSTCMSARRPCCLRRSRARNPRFPTSCCSRTTKRRPSRWTT